jgi:hypothetical protein
MWFGYLKHIGVYAPHQKETSSLLGKILGRWAFLTFHPSQMMRRGIRIFLSLTIPYIQGSHHPDLLTLHQSITITSSRSLRRSHGVFKLFNADQGNKNFSRDLLLAALASITRESAQRMEQTAEQIGSVCLLFNSKAQVLHSYPTFRIVLPFHSSYHLAVLSISE